jgi:hypothetical protein
MRVVRAKGSCSSTQLRNQWHPTHLSLQGGVAYPVVWNLALLKKGCRFRLTCHEVLTQIWGPSTSKLLLHRAFLFIHIHISCILIYIHILVMRFFRVTTFFTPIRLFLRGSCSNCLCDYKQDDSKPNVQTWSGSIAC